MLVDLRDTRLSMKKMEELHEKTHLSDKGNNLVSSGMTTSVLVELHEGGFNAHLEVLYE